MTTLRRHTTWGWIIIGILITGQNIFPNDVFSKESILVSAHLGPSTKNSDQEMDLFFKAKEHIFKRQWDKARQGFESYLKDYPEGRLRDEGLYWLANSLNMLAKDEKTKEQIIDLKIEAIARINELIDKHPKSLWRDDGMALRIEIASELVLMGQDKYTYIIEEAVRTEKKDTHQLRMLALNSLIDLDDEYVRPLLENILKTDKDPEIRMRCVQLLGKHFPDTSLELLQKLAASDQDNEIQKEASSWIDRIQQSRIPVYMKYNIYGSRLLDDSLNDEFPEGEFRTLPLETEGIIKTKDIPDLIDPIFNHKLSTLLSSADGQIPYPGFYFEGRLLTITHRAGDYQLWIKPDKLKIATDQISGIVEFRHRQTNKKTDVFFQLNKGEAKLITTRSGNVLSLMVIQFRDETAEKGQTDLLEKIINQKISKAGRAPQPESGIPDYGPLEAQAVFRINPGIDIQTDRKYFDADEFNRNLIRFGRSRARFPEKIAPSNRPVPDADRRWTLLGDIFWIKNQCRLIGFGALVIDPNRELKAQGLITIPLDDPAAYKLLQGKTWSEKIIIEETDERNTRYFFPCQINMGHGWEVLTTRHSMPSTTSGGVSDYSLSQATLIQDGREWILIGHIMHLQREKTFIARQAALINSDGEIVYGTEIEVPIENPSGAKVIKKQP